MATDDRRTEGRGDEGGERSHADRYRMRTVEVDRASHVEIVFEDDVVARFDLGELRLNCLCADCNAKRQRGRSVQPDVEAGGAVTVTSAKLAGAWGLDLDWSDGHSTGIYPWEHLRTWHDERDR